MAVLTKDGYFIGAGGTSTEIKTITYEEYLANKEIYDASGDMGRGAYFMPTEQNRKHYI